MVKFQNGVAIGFQAVESIPKKSKTVCAGQPITKADRPMWRLFYLCLRVREYLVHKYIYTHILFCFFGFFFFRFSNVARNVFYRF